jgi:hypothetical protein
VPHLGERRGSGAQQQSRDNGGCGDEADAAQVRVHLPVRAVLKRRLGSVLGTVRVTGLTSGNTRRAAVFRNAFDVDMTRWPDCSGIN